MSQRHAIAIAGWAQSADSLEKLSGNLSDKLDIRLSSVTQLHETSGNPAYSNTLGNTCQEFPKPPLLIGWSAGAMAAIETAADFPDRISGLILISATAKFCKDESYSTGVDPKFLLSMIDNLKTDKAKTLKRFMSRMFYPAKPEAQVLERYMTYALSVPDEILVHGLKYLQHTDLRKQICSIKPPTLIIHGDKDRIIPHESGLFLAKQIQCPEPALIKNAGHALPETHCSEIASCIADFV
ncbi:alpha/beta fold hydrolase [Verrucomicrobiota bacterium]